MAARLPAELRRVGGGEHDPPPERQVPRERERDPDEDDPDGQDEAAHRRPPDEDQLVDDPVGRAAVEMGEVAGREGGDLLGLVVVAADRVEHLGERPDDPAGHERLERDVEVAGRDVLVEVVGEEQHRPARGSSTRTRSTNSR